MFVETLARWGNGGSKAWRGSCRCAGRIGLIIKLFPVISWLVKNRPELAVTMQVPTREKLGIAFARDRADLRDGVDQAIRTLREAGEFDRLRSRWIGPAAGIV